MKVPAILIYGASDNNQAADLVVRYRIDGTTDWSYQSAPVGLGGILVTGVVPDTLYNVELGYRSVDGIEPTSWTAFGDVTPDLPEIETPDILDEAVTILTQQTQSNGFGGGGAIGIAYRTAAFTTFTQLDEYTFSYSGFGAIQMQWTGLLQWQRNASSRVLFFICLDQTPTYAFGAYSGFQGDPIEYQGNQNALTVPAVLPINFSGISSGTHTVSIWAQSVENTATIPVLGVGSTFLDITGKK